MNENSRAAESQSAFAVLRNGNQENAKAKGRYHVVCVGADGREKWRDVIDNLITTVGKNLIADAAIGNSAAGAAVMGLKGAGTAAAADTQASHAGWTERGLANAPAYTGNRPTPAFSAASAGVKSTSSAVSFVFTSGGNVAGVFLNVGGSATKDNTTGTLLSAGDFSNGARDVLTGDTINVSFSLTIA